MTDKALTRQVRLLRTSYDPGLFCWCSRLLNAAPEGDDEEDEERNVLQQELFSSLADLYQTSGPPQDKRAKKCKNVSLFSFLLPDSPTVIT